MIQLLDDWRLESDDWSPYSSLATRQSGPALHLGQVILFTPSKSLKAASLVEDFWGETFLKGSLVLTLADWQMCGEANAKIILR
jgi:hypothetical protein